MKLSKLDIPKFDGAYSQWTSFVDLFDEAFDSNPSLSSSQKLFYLIGLLTGEAKRLLSAITTTDANYGEARTMLQERYENRGGIVREHISTIVTASTATKEAGPLRNLMQTADEHKRALEALGLNMDEIDIYTVNHDVEKMDAKSRREWELEHPGTNHLKYEIYTNFWSQDAVHWQLHLAISNPTTGDWIWAGAKWW